MLRIVHDPLLGFGSIELALERFPSHWDGRRSLSKLTHFHHSTLYEMKRSSRTSQAASLRASTQDSLPAAESLLQLASKLPPIIQPTPRATTVKIPAAAAVPPMLPQLKHTLDDLLAQMACHVASLAPGVLRPTEFRKAYFRCLFGKDHAYGGSASGVKAELQRVIKNDVTHVRIYVQRHNQWLVKADPTARVLLQVPET